MFLLPFRRLRRQLHGYHLIFIFIITIYVDNRWFEVALIWLQEWGGTRLLNMTFLLFNNLAIFVQLGYRIRFVFYNIWLLEVKRCCIHGARATCFISDCLAPANYVRGAGRQCTALDWEEVGRRFLTATPHLLRPTASLHGGRFNRRCHWYKWMRLVLFYWNWSLFQCHWCVVIFTHFGILQLAFIRKDGLVRFVGLLSNRDHWRSVRRVWEHFIFNLIVNWHLINSYF